MEEELQCPVCLQLFNNPVILSCSHNVCYKCAEALISKHGSLLSDVQPTFVFPNGVRKSLEADKVSLISDAVLSDSDSGYFGATGSVTASGSDGNGSPVASSLASGLMATFPPPNGDPNTPPNGPASRGVTMPVLPDSVKCLTCPICHRTIFLDERGAAGLTQHTLMKNIVDRFRKSSECKSPMTKAQSLKSDNTQLNGRQSIIATGFASRIRAAPCASSGLDELCQLCDKMPGDAATVKCLQCEVSYCESCREKCHPSRGPLAKHNVVTLKKPQIMPTTNGEAEKPSVYRQNKFPPLPSKPSAKHGMKLSSCAQHPTEKNSLYCETCQVSLCVLCQEEGKHKTHCVKPIGAWFKKKKSDLSVQMSTLSNKARQAKDLVVLLRGAHEKIEKNSSDLEAKTVAQCNHLIETIERKRDELIQKIGREKEAKCKVAREQLQQCTLKLKQTTGLLEYCIEVVKDNDVAAFLQISQSLTERVSSMEKQWNSRSLQSRVESEFDLDLNPEPLALQLDQVDFVRTKVPDKPLVRIESGGSSNTVTLAWTVPPTSQPADGFQLEMDNGSNGPFKEVYCGSETLCTIDGLHLNSIYRARVRAFNKAGYSHFCDLLHLQTSEATSFGMDETESHDDVVLSHGSVVNCKSNEHKIALGMKGFSRGIHFWEFTIDRCDKRPGPAFGVALPDVSRDRMLGNDARGWSLYGPDENAAWLLHDDHFMHKYDTPLEVGSRVGVLIDLHKKCLSFFVDGKLLTTAMLTDPSQNYKTSPSYFPAVSLNNNTQVTLHTGMRAPLHGQQIRNRSVSNSELTKINGNLPPPEQRQRSSTPVLKTFSPYVERRGPKGAPPPPPIRRSSSGSISSRSDGDIGSTRSEANSVQSASVGAERSSRHSLTSFFQRKT